MPPARSRRIFALILATCAMAAAAAPPPPYGGLPTRYTYVALANMALAAPLVLAASINRAIPLDSSAGMAAGNTRFYVEADVRSLIAGDAALPASVSYLVDLPLAPADGRRRLKNVPVLLLAAPTAKPGTLRLIAPDAQVPRTPENEARLRAILSAAAAPDAAPAITGVTRAFHVAGSLPGESETQIFLRTADARPISLSILRRPGEAPRWAVALTEMVDNSAAPPRRETLLWYRLACGLPARLPDAAVAEATPDDAAATRADYTIVLAGLGPCER